MSDSQLSQQFNAQLLQQQQQQTRRERPNVSLSSSAISDMDILDIDEALKDDSFIFLEDKMHDDVCNILRQWKSNNCIPTQQQLKEAKEQQQQEQVFKLNSRTFTRPKRAGKSMQNLESSYTNTSHATRPNGLSNHLLNVEIGGMVTPMQKSFLQDTSPPSSICSSLDVSMSNSLITSADFSNSFLKSTNSLYDNNVNNYNLLAGGREAANVHGYTLQDMIRDRKALESLTMSGDGALIKDSHIGQIDEISLALSKTASGCSTMDNSTDSVGDALAVESEAANRTIQIKHPYNRTFNADDIGSGGSACDEIKSCNNNTVVLDSNEMMISDMSLNLVENSMHADDGNLTKVLLNATHPVEALNQTYKKLPTDVNACQNLTFDADERCNTPENTQWIMQFTESTPYAPSVRLSNGNAQLHNNNNNNNTDNNNINEASHEVNLSPIAPAPAPELVQLNRTHNLHETFYNFKSRHSSDLLAETMPLELEELEQIELAHMTFRKTNAMQQRKQPHHCDIELQNILDLAQAEAELLEGNDEEQFEHMLDEFSRVELTEEQQKMKKSYELIKKRFNYCHLTTSTGDNKTRTELKTLAEQTSKINNSDYLRGSSDSLATGASHSNSGSSNNLSNSRLLSRRSRLYDDVNLSMLNTSAPALDTSFIVQKPSVAALETKDMVEQELKTDDAAATFSESTETALSTSPTAYKLAEKRSRDRDRFKTIKLNKPSHDNVANVDITNVPCVTAENDPEFQEAVPQRLSRRDYAANTKTSTTSLVSHKSNMATNCCVATSNNSVDKTELQYERAQSIPPKVLLQNNNNNNNNMNNNFSNSNNYLTYKKPKDSKLTFAQAPAAAGNRSKFGFRPIGMAPLSIYNKATSAGDLQKTDTSNLPTKSSNLCNGRRLQQPGGGETTKAQLGMKSKSFHNLASGFVAATPVYSSSSAYDAAPRATAQKGARKMYNGSVSLEKSGANMDNKLKSGSATSLQQGYSQKSDEKVFKVPKLVSGIRAPPANASAAAAKRAAGLVRPSSGYFSLNVTGKEAVLPTNEADLETGRHSPTNSMSSASSCSSSIGGGGGAVAGTVTGLKTPKSYANSLAQAENAPNLANLKQAVAAGTKLPGNLKRSGLPRPKSFVKH